MTLKERLIVLVGCSPRTSQQESRLKTLTPDHTDMVLGFLDGNKSQAQLAKELKVVPSTIGHRLENVLKILEETSLEVPAPYPPYEGKKPWTPPPWWFGEEKPATGAGSKLVEISPTIASDMLRYNRKNRPMKKSHWERLAQAMLDGAFVTTPDAIAFDVSSNLVNGQHRLQALIAANSSLKFIVSWGHNMDAFCFTDRGAKRTAGDVASLDGFRDGKKCRAIAAQAMVVLDAWNGGSADFSRSRLLGDHDVRNWMLAHREDLEHSYEATRHFFPSAIFGAVHFAVGLANQPRLEDAFRRAKEGTARDKDDPAYHMRQLNEIKDRGNEWVFKLLKLVSRELEDSKVKALRKQKKEKLPGPPAGWRKDAAPGKL